MQIRLIILLFAFIPIKGCLVSLISIIYFHLIIHYRVLALLNKMDILY